MASRKAPLGPDTGRRQSVRQARSTATRPSNYYAKPFGNYSGQAEETPKDSAPGFFPAIQHFTDSIDALPKEVVRHFSMLKEVEAKVHGPDELLSSLHKSIFELPPPPRRQPQPLAQNLFSFSANNSVNGSVNGSIVNGSVASLPQQGLEVQGNSEQTQPAGDPVEMQRHSHFAKLRETLHYMLYVLDEKNAVISTANQTLTRQLARMDSSFPHVENEISEEARLGSLTHWAYVDKDNRKGAGATTTERRGRDVAATNSLAAAAAVVHEGDIAAHRSEQRRQAIAEKRSRAPADSDFDDRPAKKSHLAKVRKAASNESGKNASKYTNGVAKTEKDKDKKATREGRVLVNQTFRSAASGHSPRESPAAESSRKKPKPLPAASAARKRNATGAHKSPSLASSPLHGTFAAAGGREYSPAAERPLPSRARQGSTSKHPQTSALVESSRNRPHSSSSNKPTNGVSAGTPELRPVADITGQTIPEARSNLKDTYENKEGDTQIEELDVVGAIAVVDESQKSTTSTLKKEETNTTTAATEATSAATSKIEDDSAGLVKPIPPPIVTTRSGRQSKTATPINPAFPADIPMVRSRSTRNNSAANSNSAGSTADVPAPIKRSHKRGASQAQNQQKSHSTSRTTSKPSSPDPVRVTMSRHSSRNGTAAVDTDAADANGDVEGEGAALRGGEEEEDDEEDVDEGEERYCFCNGVSYGEMVACDNVACPREWFHLTCVGLTKLPGSKGELSFLLYLDVKLMAL
ncbi:MAG: hypothetical protein M1820_000501 [Bogoriella megaspora]|nr:MAG: hypothetical protein M1820_000501 [Bogoriella megaspora]